MKALNEFRKLKSGKLTQEQFYDYVIENFGGCVHKIIDIIDNEIITTLNEMYGTECVNRSYYELGDINVLLNYEHDGMIQREFYNLVNNNATHYLVFMNMLITKSLEANKSIEHFHIESVHYENGLNIGVELKSVIIQGL